WLAMTIQDTGIGIAADDIGKIFDAFHQVDASGGREYQGPGLGLAIAQQLVQLHKGFLWVTSKVDHGSTFTILLPAETPVLP
ncbi:MAG: hypothetical protein K8I82_09615, partial [Anaerolineae bacterium]|nr:hypothetical protein [Anaerolineae bacterium]